jgi:hypothetical protein
MNCLYITLFFNVVVGIVEKFVKSWHQLLYPQVIEVCCLPFEPCHDCDCHAVTVASNQECGDKPKFHLQSPWNPETHLLPVCSVRETSAWNPSILFCDHPLGTQHAHNFLYPNFSIIASWIVVLDILGMMWCNYLIVPCRFAWISLSLFWRRSSEIKHCLLLLCSSWTVLPSVNSWRYFITFCRLLIS